jgi:hypothetical protein
MLIQVIAIIRSYFDFEIVTRFDVQEMKLIPNVIFRFIPLPNNLNKLYEIYPQMEQEIHEIEEHESFPEPVKYLKVAEKWFRDTTARTLPRVVITTRDTTALNMIKCQIKNFIKVFLIKILY